MRNICGIGQITSLKLLACLMLFAVVGCGGNPKPELVGMPPGTGFVLRTSNGAAGAKKYTVFIPKNYNKAVKYPTIVFLHGIGESGSDGVGCTTVGLGPAIARRNGDFPFIVIFPQTGFDWCTDNSEKIMLDAVADAKANYSIDEDRVSLTGMSSGGKGTWYLGARHPEIFASLVPMGGFSHTQSVPMLTKIPIWVLHNDGDPIVGVGNTRDMLKKLEEAGGRPRQTIFSAGGHNCWDAAYDEGELFRWMMAQKRGGMATAAPKAPMGG